MSEAFKYKIICDSREKENLHILDQFKKHNIPYEVRGLATGDYRIQTLDRNFVSPVVIERKASIEELISNILEKPTPGEKLNRFEKELYRAAKSPNMKLILLIEDLNAYEKLLKGDYRSKVNPNAISGKLFALKARYNFELTYSDKKYTASNIHKILYYALREDLKEEKSV